MCRVRVSESKSQFPPSRACWLRATAETPFCTPMTVMFPRGFESLKSPDGVALSEFSEAESCCEVSPHGSIEITKSDVPQQ